MKKESKAAQKHMLFYYFLPHLMLFETEKDVKSCFYVKKLILTRKRCTEHLFAGRNTQQWILLLKPYFTSCINSVDFV